METLDKNGNTEYDHNMITSRAFPPIEWFDGGLMTERGTFVDTILPAGRWYVPVDIQFVDGHLVWQVLPDGPRPIKRELGPGLLDGFTRLSDGDDEDVLRFARKWGVLGICEHGYPCSHSPAAEPRFYDGFQGCGPVRVRDSDIKLPEMHNAMFLEPVERWMYYSRRFRASLNILAGINAGKVPNGEEILMMNPGWREEISVRSFKTGSDAIFAIEQFIDDMIRLANLRPVFDWNPTKSHADVVLAGGGLFGAFVLQLMSIATKSDGIAVCDLCGNAFAPTKKPAAGRNVFCPDCRPNRSTLNMRAKRERDRAKG